MASIPGRYRWGEIKHLRPGTTPVYSRGWIWDDGCHPRAVVPDPFDTRFEGHGGWNRYLLALSQSLRPEHRIVARDLIADWGMARRTAYRVVAAARAARGDDGDEPGCIFRVVRVPARRTDTLVTDAETAGLTREQVSWRVWVTEIDPDDGRYTHRDARSAAYAARRKAVKDGTAAQDHAAQAVYRDAKVRHADGHWPRHRRRIAASVAQAHDRQLGAYEPRRPARRVATVGSFAAQVGQRLDHGALLRRPLDPEPTSETSQTSQTPPKEPAVSTPGRPDRRPLLSAADPPPLPEVEPERIEDRAERCWRRMLAEDKVKAAEAAEAKRFDPRLPGPERPIEDTDDNREAFTREFAFRFESIARTRGEPSAEQKAIAFAKQALRDAIRAAKAQARASQPAASKPVAPTETPSESYARQRAEQAERNARKQAERSECDRRRAAAEIPVTDTAEALADIDAVLAGSEAGS